MYNDRVVAEIDANIAALQADNSFTAKFEQLEGGWLKNPNPDNILNALSAVSAAVSKHTACANGCSHCCYMAVATFSSEADRIAKYLKIKHAYPPLDLDRDALVARYKGVPCPFLKEGKCSIYEVRPMACRAYLNLSSTSDLCDVVRYPDQMVPCFDLQTVEMAYIITLVQRGEVVNDIRMWFP